MDTTTGVTRFLIELFHFFCFFHVKLIVRVRFFSLSKGKPLVKHVFNFIIWTLINCCLVTTELKSLFILWAHQSDSSFRNIIFFLNKFLCDSVFHLLNVNSVSCWICRIWLKSRKKETKQRYISLMSNKSNTGVNRLKPSF